MYYRSLGLLFMLAACGDSTLTVEPTPPDAGRVPQGNTDAGTSIDYSTDDGAPSPTTIVDLSKQPDPTLANVSTGALQGRTFGNDTIAFLGVPYGLPPVGTLRWRPTQPAQAWTGVRQATSYPPACQQSPNAPCKVKNSSEACLNLNVFVPNTSPPPGGFKVLVYFHGGSLYYCSANGRTQGTEAEMIKAMGNDVILVAVNYRLGPFGFLSHQSLDGDDPNWNTSGNYGLLDMVESLKWVKSEIAHFGGNPGKVAIAGSSGGSIAVHALYSMPLANKLFHAGCGLSWPAAAAPLAMKHTQGTKVAQLLGCDTASDVIACMRNVAADDISAILFSAGDNAQLGGWGPVVDGKIIPDSLQNLAEKGQVNDVPFCAGAQRLDTLQGAKRLPAMDKEEFDRALMSLLTARGVSIGDLAEKLAEVHALYPLSEYPQGWGEVYTALKTDTVHTCQYRRFMMSADKSTSSGTYWFRFDHGLPPDYLPRHPDSWNFLLGRVMSGVNPNPNWSDDVYEPSSDDRTVTNMFISFLKNMLDNGSPNGPTVPNWPRIGASTKGTAMIIQAGGSAVADFRSGPCDFWDSLPSPG